MRSIGDKIALSTNPGDVCVSASLACWHWRANSLTLDFR
jgi:hypothetical protein